MDGDCCGLMHPVPGDGGGGGSLLAPLPSQQDSKAVTACIKMHSVQTAL